MNNGTSEPHALTTLVQQVQQLLDRARITARVELAGDASVLLIVLLGGSRLPFTHFAATGEAQAWLETAEVEASTGTDEADNVVIALPTDKTGAIHRLTDLLTAPYIRAENAADELQTALNQHGMADNATVSAPAQGSVVVELADSDSLKTAVTLGVLLGADDIARALKLHLPNGMTHLAERLRFLLIGIVGPGVAVYAKPGIPHYPGHEDCLVIELNATQTSQLSTRITAATPLPSATTGPGAPSPPVPQAV